MSYYQYQAQQTQPHALPPPQRSFTVGPQPTHSHSHSVPNAYPNAPYNAYQAAGSGYAQPQQPSPAGHGFLPISQQQQPFPPPRTPSPFRRPLPSPQRTDPIPRSLTPGLSSPTSPPTSTFSTSASTFSLNSASTALGFNNAPSGNANNNNAVVRTHSHSYSTSDTMQKGSPGSLPSPYPPNWSPSHHQPQQQQRYQQPPPPQPQYQPPPTHQPQQPYWQSQPTPYTPQPPQRPQTAYASIHGATPPHLPPINTGTSIRPSSVFQPTQQYTGTPPGAMRANPSQGSPTRMNQPNNPLPPPTNTARTYSQPLSSAPQGNPSPTRRPLPTPGSSSHAPGPSSVFPDRSYTRSPSPIKSNAPPPRSQSPVKAIRDMFESRSTGNTNVPAPTTPALQRAPQQSYPTSGAMVLHGKGWSEDSDNGVTETVGPERERGRSGFSGIVGGSGRRASPPKFFGSSEGDRSGGNSEGEPGGSTIKLVSPSSSKPSVNPPSMAGSGSGTGNGMSAAAAYNALPPVPLTSQQQGNGKFIPLWKRGKTFTFDNTPPSRALTPNTSNNHTSSNSAANNPPSRIGHNNQVGTPLSQTGNIAGIGAGDNAAAKGRALPQPGASSVRSQPQQRMQDPSQGSAQSQPLLRSQPSSQAQPQQQRQSQSQTQPSPPAQGRQPQSQQQMRPQSQSRQSLPEAQPQSRTQPPASSQTRQAPTPPQPQTRSQIQPSTPRAQYQSQPEPAQSRPPQIRSQPLKPAADNFQPDPRRSRAQPQRHIRSRSHGPPVAHQPPHQSLHQKQQSEPPLPRGAPPGWKTTVNVPNIPSSPPLMGMKNRSRSVGPPIRGPASPNASRSGSPTKSGRAPNGWRTSVSPTSRPPPPDVDPRTGQVRPPRNKPPEGWRSTLPHPQPPVQSSSQPGSPKKRSRAKEYEMASRAPEGWRATVSNIHGHGQTTPRSSKNGGAPTGWRSTVYAPPPPPVGGGIQTGREQKRWSQPAPMTTPKASSRSAYGYGHSRQHYYDDDQDGESSLEYDSTDAYSGIYDDEEGESSFDASTSNGAAVTGDEETDGASLLSRDTGDTEDSTAESYDSEYERARAQLPRSPQHGIRELPKRGGREDVFLEEERVSHLPGIPRSPQHGIRDLPMSIDRGDASRSKAADAVGPLPRPPAMSRGETSRSNAHALSNAPEPYSRPQSSVSRFSAAESSAGGSNAGSGIGSRRNSALSTTSSKGEWPAGVPPLPRAPGSASRSSFGSEAGAPNDRRLAEQRMRREREMIDLDDAPPAGFSALRRTPSPSPTAFTDDDYDHGFNMQSRNRPQFPFRPSTAHSHDSRQSSQPDPPPRQSSPIRPLPQPSQLQRSRSQRSQASSQYQASPSVPSTPSSRPPPLPPRAAPSVPSSPVVSHIEIQSPAPISGWDRADLPKIEVNDGPKSNSSMAPVIAVSAPSISISGIDDDDDDNGMGPMISVSVTDDNAEGNKPAAKRPLPPLHRGGGLICAGCGGAIVGRIVSAMSLRWHPACFRCTICDELLEHVSSYEHEGRPYCHLDYHENFAPRCYSCKTAIIEERFISLDDPALGKRTYHEQHFFCAECGDPFLAPSSARRSAQSGEMEVNVAGDGEFVLDDDVGFTVYKGHPYCEACHVRLRMPKCKKCKKSIRDGMQAVEALGGKWCYECFVCAGCERPFDDPSFFQRGDKPFCERCFSIILRNEI